MDDTRRRASTGAVARAPAPDLAGRWLAVTGLLLAVSALVPQPGIRPVRYVLAETAQPARFEAVLPALLVPGAPWRPASLAGRAAPRAGFPKHQHPITDSRNPGPSAA